jgi:glycosyltransferase involved in cell wall biosynthesis
MTSAAPPLLLHVFPTFGTGGREVRFAAVANRFGQRWRHAIVAMDGDLSCRERLDPGLDVSYPQFVLPKGNTLDNVLRCRAALHKLAPSLLVTNNWGAIEWAMANLVPVARHVHVEDGLGPDEVEHQFSRRIWTRRLVLRRSTVVLPSHGLMRMAREIWHLPPTRLRLIPNGVDLGRFKPPVPHVEAVPVIGTVAALRIEKNLARLLHAFQIVRQAAPARLVIVGDGEERPGLEALAAELGVAADVRFAGHTARPEREYAGFDIFALSSDTEQMPLSVLEAMAASLAIAATNVGDVALMVAKSNQRFVTAKEVLPLAAALLELVRSPDLRRQIGAANRARAEQEYDQEAMFEAWASEFDEIAAAPEPRRAGLGNVPSG